MINILSYFKEIKKVLIFGMDKDVDLVKHTNLVIDLGMVVEMTISVLLDFMAVVNAQVFLFEHLV